MLPPFDERGYLPFGIHSCTVDELAARFGSGSPEREIETRELVQFIQWAQGAGVRRLIVNGSYVTQKEDPNDVDLVILPGPDYPRDKRPVSEEEEKLWPFLHIFVADDDADLEAWALRDFGTDREFHQKGVIEIPL